MMNDTSRGIFLKLVIDVHDKFIAIGEIALTIILLVLTSIGIVFEWNTHCDDNIIIWLIGECGINLFSLFLTALSSIQQRYQIQVLISIINLFNILYVICRLLWFVLGNLWLYNASYCIMKTPIVFFTMITYIFVIDMYTILRLWLKFYLYIYPQHIYSREDDVPASNLNINSNFNLPNLLEVYYRDLEIADSVTCSICLEDFEIQSKVISLSCNEKHVFHSSCLRNWFQSVASNHLQNSFVFSCPVCRFAVEI